MKKSATVALCALIGLSSASLTSIERTEASGFNPMNMVNPSKWFGNRNDDYDDHYYGDRYAPPPGYYGGPYGAPYGIPGYGAPGYAPQGYYAPAQVQPAAPAAAPADGSAERIRELEERIRQLEAEQQPAPPGHAPVYEPSAPVFRPN